MKFNRKELIQRIRDEMTRRETATGQRNYKAKKEYDENLARYLEQTTNAWNTFANTIKRRIRAGQPVTAEDIPAELKVNVYRGQINVWDGKHTDFIANTESLIILLSLLEATNTDEITATSLERMGFRMTSLFKN